jgi:Sugar phosphate permease
VSNEQKFYGWKLAGALWVVYLINLGFPLYGGAVINSYLLKDIAMERATYGLGFSLVNLFNGLGAPVAGMLVLKYGIRNTFAIGGLLLLIGSLGLSQLATEPWQYLLFFGGFIGCGLGLATMLPMSTAITRWFVRFRGRAMAIVLTAGGFAGFIASPVINKVIVVSGGNWRIAWATVGGFAVVAAIIAYLFVKERPQDLGQIPDGKEPDAAQKAAAVANPLVTKYAWAPSEVYKNYKYWLAVLACGASQWPFFFFTAHWIMHLRGKGIDPATAAFAMGLFTLGGIGGRLVGGWLMDKMVARYVFMSGFIWYFIGSYLALQVSPTELTAVYIAAICYGAAFGWCFTAQLTMLGHYFGPAAFPKINGTMLAVTAVLCSAAGVVGGKMFDIFKSYTEAFELNVAICVVGLIVLLFTSMPDAPAVKQPDAKSRPA